MLNKDILLASFNDAIYTDKINNDKKKGATFNLIENILFSNFNIAKFMLDNNICSIIYHR